MNLTIIHLPIMKQIESESSYQMRQNGIKGDVSDEDYEVYKAESRVLLHSISHWEPDVLNAEFSHLYLNNGQLLYVELPVEKLDKAISNATRQPVPQKQRAILTGKDSEE